MHKRLKAALIPAAETVDSVTLGILSKLKVITLYLTLQNIHSLALLDKVQQEVPPLNV